MFLVRMIPLARLPAAAPGVLDYFWPDRLIPGALVRGSMGNRTVPGIVVDVRDIRTAKQSVKRSDFELKKLTAVVSDIPQLTPAQLELARWLALQYACSPATALKTVAPTAIGKRGFRCDHGIPAPKRQKPSAGTAILTDPDAARSAVRDMLRAAKGQTLILVPDRAIISAFTPVLPDGFAVLHGDTGAAEMRRIYRGVLDGSIRVVAGTRVALFLPWSSLSTLIVEDPLNEFYKSDMAPKYNAPDVARHLAALHGATVTWLTPALSTVQYSLAQAGTLRVTDGHRHWPSVTVTTARTEAEAGNRSLFSRAAQDAILSAYESRLPLLIFSARRAYATVAACSRCHESVSCATCGIPLRWHRTSEDMLVCYGCGAFRNVPGQCAACHAGTIKPSGVPGSQKLAETVRALLDRYGHSGVAVPILDSDLVRSADDARRVFATYDAMAHPILVATAIINGYRYERRFDTIIVPHTDMLTVDPDYRTHDRLILQVEKLADLGPSRMILQTYHEDPIIQRIAAHDWEGFFKEELAYRKTFRWPPYVRLVRLTHRHRSRNAARQAAALGADRLRRAIAHTGAVGIALLGPIAALVEQKGGLWTHHLVMKSTAPASVLSEVLRYVPDGWSVDVDPRAIA